MVYFSRLASRLLFIIGIIILSSSAHAAKSHHIKIIYFYSESCIHCEAAKPAVIDLSREYDVEGCRFGGGKQQLPFPVKAGDKKIAKEYGVNAYPALAILVDGMFRQKIAGTSDVQDAHIIIKALEQGGMTVTEAVKNDRGEEIKITGWISSKGEYFKKAQFAITDRTTELPVNAWLPLEAVKSPFRTKENGNRPRLMSDVVRKPVLLEGSIKKTGTSTIFHVREEIRID